MAGKFMTVVFEITDDEKFDPVKNSILRMFSQNCNGNGAFRVTAVSNEDEMSRLDELEKRGVDVRP